MGFARSIVEERQRYKRRRRTMRLCASVVATWGLAGAVLVSTTATAGLNLHVPDIEFRRTTMIEPSRLTLTPPRLSPLMMHSEEWMARYHEPESALIGLSAHIRRVDLARANRVPTLPGQPLLFLENRVLLPGQRLDPALNLHRAGRLLAAHLSTFGGRTPALGHAGPTPSGPSRAALTLSRPDGATPAVSRATALASVTPAPVEPEIIMVSTLRIPSIQPVTQALLHIPTVGLSLPDLDLSDPETRRREMKCLAEAVYFEARSEPETGQAAVAQVVINRAKSGLYPTSICGVVYQNRHRYKACQFTFACEGKALVIREPDAWAVATRVAQEVLEGQIYLPAVGASTHYHADYVAPWWSRRLKRTDRIGRHIFYRLRPGQT
ncbi:cell wall hydrolase [Rhabdaerophilum sp.]|uniref:cell wall hydrolase n=1 Tax=Rhabdaerophilum sp. TaxID=2717341 RepID=UPI0038D50299